jgi:hypothetical protein
MFMSVADGKGQDQTWSVEFSDLNKLSRAGLVRDSIKIGDPITITAFGSKAGGDLLYLGRDSPESAAHARVNHFARAIDVTLTSGKKITVPN